MGSFRWGTVAEFLTSARLEDRGVQLAYGPGGSQLGRIDVGAHGGTGAIEYLHSDALRVAIFDCSFHEDRVFNVTDAGWMRLNIGLNLSVEMALGDELHVRVAQPSCRFICLPQDETTVETVPAGVRLQWVTVCCRPELLKDWAGAHPSELTADWASTVGPSDAVVHRDFKLTPLLQDAATDILGARPEGRLRAAYVAAKAQELLVLGLDQLLRPQTTGAPAVKLTKRDIRALHAVRTLIEENLAHAPSVQALSLKAGINRNKLFYGFKSLFGVSVSQHLQDRRIEEGYRLLTTTAEPLGEIAARVGFRHQCNFSTAFRARYGFAPRALRTSVESQRA
jgi:AraC-like DNA-binding protein